MYLLNLATLILEGVIDDNGISVSCLRKGKGRAAGRFCRLDRSDVSAGAEWVQPEVRGVKKLRCRPEIG